ncbi:MAG: RAMP superfamily CRISPR-associated protein, partial [Rhodocyclaceae bacterium]
MKRLSLSIELLEDLHIGTGTGWGDIDALLVRDRHGRPVLPASHIKGLLREAANEWCRSAPSAHSRQAIDRLFGRPGSERGRLQLTSAYLAADATVQPLVWGSTAIDDQGKAEERSLRFVEYIPAGSRFVMQASLPMDDEQDETLLETLIARCRRLGGGRNRGHGLVRWHLEATAAGDPLSVQGVPVFPGRLRLLLRNLDPICMARTGHPGNLIASESFIRGRSLRGAFVAACLAIGQAEAAQALLADTLSWGDALPLPDLDLSATDLATAEALPIPLSIGTPKATAPSADIPCWVYRQEGDFLGSRGEIDQIALEPNDRPQEKLKRPASGEFLFQSHPAAPWRRYRPRILERLHTAVPSEENAHEQALFSAEELAERTLFLADLIVSTPQQGKTLTDMLHALDGAWLRIGRGGHPLSIEAAAWLPLAAHGRAAGPEFTLLLESELIARDPLGNFRSQLDANTLAELVGLPADGIEITVEAAFSEGSDLFGFNAVTGLPRLAQRAIKAGSVVRVAGADAPRLRQALAARLTLGECPEEGFGRFRLDFLPKPRPTGARTVASGAPRQIRRGKPVRRGPALGRGFWPGPRRAQQQSVGRLSRPLAGRAQPPGTGRRLPPDRRSQGKARRQGVEKIRRNPRLCEIPRAAGRTVAGRGAGLARILPSLATRKHSSTGGSPMTPYRTLVFARIVQESALSIGGNHPHGLVDSPLARDGQGRPVIRGSTLAGCFIATARALAGRLPRAITSRGIQSQRAEQGGFIPSAWRFAHAHPLEAKAPTTFFQHVSIDARTLAAKDDHLFNLEALPPGISWNFELEIVPTAGAEFADLEALAAATLARWQQPGGARLGRGSRHGYGWCH